MAGFKVITEVDVALGILLAVAILIAAWFVITKLLEWYDLWKGVRALRKSTEELEADMKAEGITYDDLEKIGRWNEAMRKHVQEGGPEPPPWQQC